MENLRWRAWQRGIRLSADMVPNHMGIDSTWVAEHPDWFLSVSNAPYPAYSFNEPDLSDDGRMGVYLEDHYYSKTDAAVVFKRIDRYTGEAKYIYHGNDGTSMPWNDTAQLDYSNPVVREAVIQTILHVARNFPDHPLRCGDDVREKTHTAFVVRGARPSARFASGIQCTD